MTDVIVTENLRKQFGQLEALRDLNLKIEPGVCVGYLGPNGAGKTTTIKILTSLMRPTGGRAFLNGTDVVRNPKQALASVGAVVETPQLYPQLTPVEILSYFGHLRGLDRNEIRERTIVVLEDVKMSESANKRTGDFSTGMKQRVAIAQALLHDPSILILDEPTIGLDPRGMIEVRELIRHLKLRDFTIFMSSHLLNEVQEVCDKVAIVDKGTLLAYDTVANLSKLSEGVVSLTAVEPITANQCASVQALPNVRSVTRVDTSELLIAVDGGLREQAELLAQIHRVGIRVAFYRPAQSAIEDVYLRLVPEEEV
ncbi:MAG TPA: ABC transporter ATP-binding protein [Candidatus Bathyarchaeia archaeon]|nr:ABC transporter ATP-binding protein [Candidatus Bathyarchaeia archaeon]